MEVELESIYSIYKPRANAADSDDSDGVAGADLGCVGDGAIGSENSTA